MNIWVAFCFFLDKQTAACRMRAVLVTRTTSSRLSRTEPEWNCSKLKENTQTFSRCNKSGFVSIWRKPYTLSFDFTTEKRLVEATCQLGHWRLWGWENELYHTIIHSGKLPVSTPVLWVWSLVVSSIYILIDAYFPNDQPHGNLVTFDSHVAKKSIMVGSLIFLQTPQNDELHWKTQMIDKHWVYKRSELTLSLVSITTRRSRHASFPFWQYEKGGQLVCSFRSMQAGSSPLEFWSPSYLLEIPEGILK